MQLGIVVLATQADEICADWELSFRPEVGHLLWALAVCRFCRRALITVMLKKTQENCKVEPFKKRLATENTENPLFSTL